VSSIDSRVDPVTRSVQVRALLPNPERLLKPGMLMQVTLRNKLRDTLVIPEAALMPFGRDQFVLRVVPDGEGHKAEKRQIRIGSRRPGEVEILDGLQAGDRVITHGTIQVRPGQAVNIRANDDGSRSLAEILQEKPATAGDGE
jgi:membrane fusion protein (multidrug efflux system)